MDVNKGGGVDLNKRDHLSGKSEACWVIKERVDEGALCGWISWTTPHFVCREQSHCCVRVRACRTVGMCVCVRVCVSVRDPDRKHIQPAVLRNICR